MIFAKMENQFVLKLLVSFAELQWIL